MVKKPLINWFGGKFTIADWVIGHLSRYPHNHYVEPFGGGASVLLRKRPSPIETYNDLNDGLVTLFRVVSDTKLFRKFRREVLLLPHSRTLFNDFKRKVETERYPVRKAVMVYALVRQSFAGMMNHFGYSVCGNAGHSASWVNSIEYLPAIHARLKFVQMECLPAIEIIDRYDTSEALFYLDPPYVHGTRSGSSANKDYKHEMTDCDHEALVDRLLAIKGYAVLSGYHHPIYEKLLQQNWTISTKETIVSSAGGRNRAARPTRTECLYLSPCSADIPVQSPQKWFDFAPEARVFDRKIVSK